MVTVTDNKVKGLAQGPIKNFNASRVVNAIYDSNPGGFVALIGCPVFVQPPAGNDAALHILPEVNSVVSSSDGFFGILVGGVNKGIYPPTGVFLPLDPELTSISLVAAPGGTVRVCTQGICIANVNTQFDSYDIGDPLKAEDSHLFPASSGAQVVARVLQPLVGGSGEVGSFAFIAVDVQREGILP